MSDQTWVGSSMPKRERVANYENSILAQKRQSVFLEYLCEKRIIWQN